MAVYRRLLRYARPYLHLFFLALIGNLCYAATDAGIAALLKPMIDNSFIEQDPYWITMVPLLLILLAVVRGVGGFIASYLMASISFSIIRNLRSEIFDRLLRLPVAYFDSTSSGMLMSKMSYNVEQLSTGTAQAVSIVIRDAMTIILLLGWMFYLNWQLSLVFFLLGPVVALLVVYINRRFRRISTRIQDSMGGITQVTEQAIEGNRIIRIFAGREQESILFDGSNRHNARQQLKLAATRESGIQVIQLIVAISLAVIVYLGILAIQEGTTVGSFFSFMTAMMMLLSPVKRLMTVNATIQKAIAAGHSIFELLDTDCEQDDGTGTLERAKGEVEYRNLSFSYTEEKGEVLKDINFRAEAGQTIAFVGRSGSGKSTLVNLLPRFYELQQGEILLDGINIRELKLDDLRNQIALVNQEVTLFNNTIARNIAYGAMAEAGDEQIRRAAEAARVMEFAERLPDGLETVIGEKGVMLSGGQRQRIAIARALLKDAPILILDEATSALDTESERHIQAALQVLIENRTTFVIAHRLSTIEHADRIIAMDQGRIVEQGQHEELLAKNGYYASLYAMQFSETAE